VQSSGGASDISVFGDGHDVAELTELNIVHLGQACVHSGRASCTVLIPIRYLRRQKGYWTGQHPRRMLPAMSGNVSMRDPAHPGRVLIIASNPAISAQTGWPIGFWWGS
jgi:hypothetical protein